MERPIGSAAMRVGFGERPLLMAIVGPQGARSAGEAVRGGAHLVQVRAKELDSRALERLVREVIDEVGGPDRVIVNSRPDIAELSGALGVHLPETGLDPRSVRQAFPGLLIGVSRHEAGGLEPAALAGADFVMIGPVFETVGKEERALGLDRLEGLLRGVKIPVVAVGGVTPPRVAALLARGVSGIAAIRPFEAPGEASLAAARFREAIIQSGGAGEAARPFP